MDEARLALVVEGGSARGAFSHGMIAALEDLDLLHCFDAVYGSSAGALNAAWLLCGRASTGLTAWRTDIVTRVIAPWRIVLGGPVVDTRYLVETVYEHVVPMDFAAILANAVTFHPLATDADTGASVDLHPYITDVTTLKQALRATTCLPILAGRPIRLAGRRFVDSGVSESVPARTAFAQGATHALVLRTRRDDERMTAPSPIERRVVERFLARHAPGALEPWLARVSLHTRDEQALVDNPAVLQIRPPAAGPAIGRLERGTSVIRRAIELGHATATATLATYLPDLVTD